MIYKRKGIFCLEGFWYGDHRDKTSVFPLLDLAQRFGNLKYVHHRCGTVEEFQYALKRWKVKGFHSQFPFLYLAFHGKKGIIQIGKRDVSLDELAEILKDKCEGVVIYFASCDTLNVNKRKLQDFMFKTKSIALMGYNLSIDWMVSASFEVLLLHKLQKAKLDTRGMKTLESEIKTDCKWHVKQLDFKLAISESLYFKRSRPRNKIVNT